MKKWIILLIILIIIVGAVFFFTKGKHKNVIKVAKGEVTKGELSLKVSARGKIEARDRFELKAKIPGVIMFILEEGTFVKKDELVAAIDDKELQARKRQEETNLVNCKNNLAKLNRRLDIKELENRVKEAEVLFGEIERQALANKELFESKVISMDELKKTRADYDKTRLQLEIVRTQLEERINTHQEEMASVISSIKAIEVNLASIEQQILWSKITSPISGIVAQREIKEGSWVNQGQLLSVVVSDKEFVAKVNLDEVDISKISLGMPVSVILDAFLGKVVTGKIKKIAPSPKLTEKINTFEVTIQLKSSTDIDIKSEMLCDVVIISGLKKDCLKIPQEAIVNIEGKDYVFVIKDNIVSKDEVTSGFRNPNEVEVLSGVQQNEEVVLNPPLELKDKARVMIKEDEE
ncbi:efflux RND transporter periplasmic adaptor subunit [Candidatus Desantisbacteria bacterium]|nr:efflux RND transporter periplasmic adaptor subunit [Candidatus Desantisbacteria bacterium]